ncbi:hypothetical protein BCR44DRAFT_39537 [Catenaria anguillulae PL171]|uniref:Uncharacterized protein n=1 Tax=Catenaria anguillulae PL171 TaxID=765915 RepID=A0A1Y2HP18_9FUNG|nr:hypothetical protein BCR44DRAFT_39537 [Catenaria anguillulae PL171]
MINIWQEQGADYKPKFTHAAKSLTHQHWHVELVCQCPNRQVHSSADLLPGPIRIHTRRMYPYPPRYWTCRSLRVADVAEGLKLTLRSFPSHYCGNRQGEELVESKGIGKSRCDDNRQERGFAMNDFASHWHAFPGRVSPEGHRASSRSSDLIYSVCVQLVHNNFIPSPSSHWPVPT